MQSKAVAPGQHGADSKSYVYSKLSDLSPNRIVNLWGVVKFKKEPQRSRGTDYFQTFSIVDDSLDPKDESAKLSCIWFQTDLNLFSPMQVGDVVRLHRFKIQVSNNSTHAPSGTSYPIGSLQAVSSIGNSFVAFDGDPNAELKPRTMSKEFTFSDIDKVRARELRQWARNSNISSPVRPTTTRFQTTQLGDPQVASTSVASENNAPATAPDGVKWFDSVTLNSYFDTAALVIGIGVRAIDRSVLFVTDGSLLYGNNWTLPPFANVDPSEMTSLRMDDGLYDRFRKWMMPVIVFDDHCATAELLRPGDFVFLKNLHCCSAKSSNVLSGGGLENRGQCVEIILHGRTHFGRGLRKLQKDELVAMRLNDRIEALAKVAAEAQAELDTSMAIDDDDLGPFAELLQRQSRHHSSQASSPSKQQTDTNGDAIAHEDPTDDNADDWEYVTMRDVGIQVDLP